MASLPWAAERAEGSEALCPNPDPGGEAGHGPHLGTVLGDEEELSESTVQGKEDARLGHVLKQAVLHVGEELPQGF